MRIVHPVAAERRIIRVDEHGEVLGARRSPKRATAVAVFDKLVAFPSLLTHPNLTIEVLLLREDHIRRPRADDDAGGAPATRGSGGSSTSSDRVTLRTTERHPRGAARRSRTSRSARASSRRSSAAARCWPSARSTACGRSGSSTRPASAAAAPLHALRAR